MLEEDDDQDRLLIDDPEQSIELEKPKSPGGNFTPPDFEEAFDERNGISQSTLISNMEEGELDEDEAMDTSFSKKNAEEKTITQNDRKRVNGEASLPPSEVDISPIKKTKLKPEPETVEKGTCVHSEATQADVEESVFELEAGSSFPLQLTVVCRIEGTETLYFSAKWKDRELSGILTDGDPPGFANFAKKRMALSNNSTSESEKASVSTPKKRVRGSEIKKKKADEEDEDLDVTGMDTRDSNSSTGSIKLVEVTSSLHLHPCPVNGCEHAYASSQESEYHISTVHKKKSVIFEHNSTQTQTDGINKTLVSVQTDTDGLNVEEKKEESFHSNDDDVAPVLLKEEPRSVEANGVIATPSTSKPSTIQGINQTTPSIPASPRASNGLLAPVTFSSPFPVPTSSAVSTPSREKQPEPKPTPSPARSGFHPMLPGPSHSTQQQQQQLQQQAQILQIMQMQAMIQAGGRGPFAGIPTPHDLAAIQALQQAGTFPMFPKH